MTHNITRRDFLNGVAIGTGASMLAPFELLAQTSAKISGSYYPPLLNGMRGSHPGSFEVMHSLAWNGVKPAAHSTLNEHYDLVIVGAGISGLAAAHFWQKRMGNDAKILLLDNHDDFGGHAKRNEFHLDGETLLGIGGSVNLEAPTEYSMIAGALLEELGVDLQALRDNMQTDGMLSAGSDSILALPGNDGHVKVSAKWTQLMFGAGDYEAAVRALPLPPAEQDKVVELLGGERDYLDDLSLKEKYAYIESVSYTEFLTDKVGLAASTIPVFFSFPVLMVGAAVPRVTVLEAIYFGCPGIQGMGWLGQMAADVMEGALAGYESLYFPDGNATAARLLVHKLVPAVAPNTKGFEDIATSQFDYGALDSKSNAVRIRLNSTVVGVREADNNIVTVDYVDQGKPVSVTGEHCILACYNGAIPYICPQLPETQKEALRYSVKIPLVMTNVLVKDGQAFAKLGARQVSCPYDPYVVVTNPPATVTGGYQPPSDPSQPAVIYMLTAPRVDTDGSETNRELWLRARHELYTTTFDTYEQQIRDQLQGLLGEHGFKHETDIKAITVNRWPHGYAHEYMTMDDGPWPEGQAPHILGRKQFGRISIANSDSEARAYLDAAIDAGWRAVAEQAS